MTIVVCTSMKFVDEVREFREKYQSDIISIITPQLEHIDTEWESMNEPELILAKKSTVDPYFDKIKKADKVLVWNQKKHGKNGYIGPNTLMEMTVRYIFKKPLYVLENPQDEATRLEVLAMQPIILDSVFGKLFD